MNTEAQPEVMNPPASAAEGAEAGNLTQGQLVIGLGVLSSKGADSARPADRVPPPAAGDPCPVCATGRIGQSGYNYRCANCGWLGPRVEWAP